MFALAGEKYAAALAVKPDKHEVLNNWGVSLFDQARMKTGEEAYRLFALAGEKYAAALAIKPDKHDTLNNWGIALAAQANTKPVRRLTGYLLWLARSTPPHSPSSPTTTRS